MQITEQQLRQIMPLARGRAPDLPQYDIEV